MAVVPSPLASSSAQRNARIGPSARRGGYRAADRRRRGNVLLEDRVAIVTGVGAGMGRAIALRSAAEGAAVVGVDVDGERGAATMAEAGGHFVRGDVGD